MHRSRLRLSSRLGLLISMVLLPAVEVAADDFRPTASKEIIPKGARVRLLWNEGDFTEGPTVAADGAILFSDIGNRIMRFDPVSRKITVFRASSGKTNGLMFDRQGRLIACEGAAGGNRRISITEDGKVRTLADRYEGKRFNSPNDLAIDAKGRVYFTDPRYGGDEPRELDFEGVFLVDTDGKVTLATREVQKPNGVLVSIDGKTVYVADNNNARDGNRHLTAFRVQPDGTLAEKRVLFDFGPTRRGIDGMTLDTSGNLYATAGRGDEAGIYVFSPEGKHLAFIPTPGDPTNCVFGGPNQPNVLYITAAGPKPKEGRQRYALYAIRLATDGHRIYPTKPTTMDILKTFRDEFVAITPGRGKYPAEFTMGGPNGEKTAQPSRTVKFDYTFAIAKYEVPQNLWQAVMDGNPSRWKGPRNSVEMLSYDEAVAFCEKATEQMRTAGLITDKQVIRLPSEAEWEYTARAGTTTAYSFGDDEKDLTDYGWYNGNAAGNDPPVGAKNPNPWGLYDIHGYLWEWCADPWHDRYEGAPTDGSAWTKGGDAKRGVLRGGSWKDKAPGLRSGIRRGEPRTTRDDAVGLRCVLAEEKA